MPKTVIGSSCEYQPYESEKYKKSDFNLEFIYIMGHHKNTYMRGHF
jgi:hypothetical protein